ncbi:Dual specificity protein phosphatase [Salinarchaeum sp. Harcht-Bsk1]|uniref:protein-tyrosine phosphatase family protein n=1 Tax=Salinarchaeum sp. Harcht-Bsk1 TaxID=1333523 RepID=UPI000342498F|nr:dual specificity protein phosphatase family protein [Salinarchaeum sp. Harcht-Bsk1]AGN02321.1 Dual specificity protein phosphatase [Salinarchaeum sp. Harcht-Bsk1]
MASQDDPRIEFRIDGRELEGPHVRPFGCHPEASIVRQIGDRPLYLGNCHAADPAYCDRAFDAVLTVAKDPAPATTHHRPMPDSREATWEQFRSAADAACECYREEGDLLVHCKAGISRSTAVVAATVAVEERRHLSEAYDVVRAHRPYAVSHPQIRKLAAYYVAAYGN